MKNYKYLIVTFLIFLIAIGILVFTSCWTNETKALVNDYAMILVTGVGFLIAIYQLRLTSNQYFEDLKRKEEDLRRREKDYLDLVIKTKSQGDFYSIKTQVINKAGENKAIDYSFLLLTKQESNIIEDVNNILHHLNADLHFNYTNNFNQLKEIISEPVFINHSIGVVPIEFYFSENVGIGNESPCYTYSFDNEVVNLDKGIYSVRFFIFPNEGYHRSTVDSLIIK